MSAQRYVMKSDGLYEDEHGPLVRYEEHEAEVEQLEAKLKPLEPLEAEVKRIRAAGWPLVAALSRIDYLCAPPNEMECSGYDVHCDEELVVKAVERLREDNQALALALRLAIAGKPVRNADELLARAVLEATDGE